MSSVNTTHRALRIALYFAITGILWIFFSDRLASLLFGSGKAYETAQTLKGWFFVLMVSVIIFFIVRNQFRKIKAIDSELLESEKRYRKALDILVEGAQVIDFNWRITYINDTACRHGKKSKEAHLGKTIEEVYPGIRKSEFYHLLETCMHERIIRYTETSFKYPDGSVGWFEVSIHPIREGVFILSNDITKRKLMELELKASEERLKLAQRIARMGDFTWNVSSGKVSWSDAMYQLLGYDQKEMIDYTKVNQQIHHPDDLEKVVQWLNNSLASGEKILHPFEYRIVNKTGKIIYCRTQGVINYSDGKPESIFATVQDITALKEVNLQLERTNNELTESLNQIKSINQELEVARNKAQQSEELKSAFLANMSHEIRTPLNGIVGFSDILLKSETLTADQKKRYSTLVHQCSNSLMQIVDDILDISSLETGNIQLNRQKHVIGEILGNIYDLFKEKAGNKGLRLELTLPPDYEKLAIKTDAIRLSQVLTNLVDNAIKFTPEGKVEYGLKTVADDRITLFVRDTGMGIPPEDFNIIFNRFRQGKRNEISIYGGNGLGLSIVKQLLELMHGTIQLESEVNQGTVFYLDLPVS